MYESVVHVSGILSIGVCEGDEAQTHDLYNLNVNWVQQCRIRGFESTVCVWVGRFVSSEIRSNILYVY